MNKQKNKSDFLVNGQPKYANVVKANEQAVGYNLGMAQAKLLEQQKRLVEQTTLMQTQEMMMRQKEDELRKLHEAVMSAINSMPIPPMPDEMMGQQMMSPEMAMGGQPPQGGMPPEMAMGGQPPQGGMPPEMAMAQGQQGFI